MQFTFSNDYFKLLTLHRKPYFLFPDVLKRSFFQKNCAGIWSFLYYRERWYFFFPKIWSYPLCGKWKMIFFKKIHGNIFPSNVPNRWSFQEELRWDTIFLVISEKMAFFFPKTWYFFLGRKMRDDFSLEIRGNMIFSLQWGQAPLPNKNQIWSCPVKIHLKVTDALDWHSR